MDLKEMFAKINTGEVAAHSELGTRDESKQMTHYTGRIRKMKTVTGINAHALVMKDVVIPFNPFTCKSDDTYNATAPFRPILLVSQVITGLKSSITDPKVQAEWEKKLGISISWGEPATHEEYLAFKKRDFIKPRIMSYSTVRLNFGGVGGFSEFPQKYTVDPTELNENGSYDPEKAPIHHKAAVFFNTMVKREADELVNRLNKEGANKETITTQRRAVFSKSPVGFVRPSNLIPFLYFPINEKPGDLSPDDFMRLETYMRYYSYDGAKWDPAFSEVKENDAFDDLMNYYDFRIKTPSSSDTKSDGKVFTDNDGIDLYRYMTIGSIDSRLGVSTGSTTVDGTSYKNSDLYAPVFATAEAYFLNSQEQSGVEGGETFEKIMAASNNFRPITGVQDRLLPACNEVFLKQFASSPYFTEDVKKANHEFFIAMNPDNAMALADADDDELDEAASNQAKTLAALIKDATDDGEDPVSTIDLENIPLADDD